MNTKKASSSGVPSAGYSVTVRMKIENNPGNFSQLVQAVADAGASIAEVVLQYSDFNFNIRLITISCKSEAHSREVIELVKTIPVLELLEWQDDTFAIHRGGKLNVESTLHLHTTDELARVYTPGVARICTHIEQNPQAVYDYTIKRNCVAVATDGSAVLGLGNIGPEASMPVMEGKAMLFKQFGGINAFPICLATQDTDEIVATLSHLAPVFGGINLEDIAAPRCFEIEDRLRESLSIPVFHDDQHGTAAVVLAGLINAARLTNRVLEDMKVVVNGFGAGGVACTRMLHSAGIKNIIPCDSRGTVYRGRKDGMNPVKEEVIQFTNPDNVQGSVGDALKGADAFVGVSVPGTITRDDVAGMAKDPIIFALANPIPEILPEEIEDIAAVVATGRSDYANQVNNVLCFPGMFKGALACRATDITDNMKIASARAIAAVVSVDELSSRTIIPGVFSADIADIVSRAVQEAAIKDGVSQLD